MFLTKWKKQQPKKPLPHALTTPATNLLMLVTIKTSFPCLTSYLHELIIWIKQIFPLSTESHNFLPIQSYHFNNSAISPHHYFFFLSTVSSPSECKMLYYLPFFKKRISPLTPYAPSVTVIYLLLLKENSLMVGDTEYGQSPSQSLLNPL